MNKIIAGIDEVGRGCLAGPVVTAAVILPDTFEPWIDEIKDSKQLTVKKREQLAEIIEDKCKWSIRESNVHTIDSVNILRATLLAMEKTIKALPLKPDLILVDGPHRVPGIDIPQEPIKHGDSISKVIGAASILAKVYRDRLMQLLHLQHPEYGWNQNKGYGTEKHREAIMVHGVTSLHRKTFKGVSEYV